jgi:formate dehydrogenase maturation protein FdhE
VSKKRTDEEILQELEGKIEKMKARKQQVEARKKEKERKERTRRLIQVGAIFEKHFEIQSEEEAVKIAKALQAYVGKNKEKILHHDVVVTQKKKTMQEGAYTKE